MLILSRRQGESFFITTTDGEIEVILLDRRGYSTRVGINAPETCNIVRREISLKHNGTIDIKENQAKEGI